jgi:hypothetical protein
VELVREGVAVLQNKYTPGWRLTARRAMYYCQQAESAKTGWGAFAAVEAPTYQNQERVGGELYFYGDDGGSMAADLIELA